MIQSNLFKDVVLTGITCGLHDPREWIRNYDHSLMMLYKYEDIPEIEQELFLIAKELYEATHMTEEYTNEDIWKWVASNDQR
jgi:hypothetical protein